MDVKPALRPIPDAASGLAKLPHDPGHHYLFLDLSEQYDEKLLTRFYKDLMIPNFPIQDELDPLEKWVELLSPFGAAREPSAESPPDFHVLLLLKQKDDARNFDDASIMGGVVFEYYVSSNTGLLTYLLVSSKSRSLGLGRILTDRCRDSLEKNAKSRGHLAGCNAIFLETNSASKVQESEDVMSPAQRHQIFFKMGLRLVDFDYVQAPLFRGKKKVNFLLLCVFLTPRIPKLDDKSHEDCYYLPSALLKNTIRAFWSHSSRITQYRYQDDVDFKRMMDQLSRREKISLLDLPWERPFTIVDLRTYFDLELLVSFYQDMLSPCFKGRQDELDSLDTWITMLTPSFKKTIVKNEIRDDNEESLHVLLALKYSEDEEENAKPMIAGGLAFEYYPSNNCGLLTYLITPAGERGGRMARALIVQALEQLDSDARLRGQLGGCNVVFMETSDNAGVAPAQPELIDMTQQPGTLEKMGWKMLDFEYIQPPFTVADTIKKRAMNLMVFMTPRIPKLSQEESEYLFLPRSTVKNFIKDVWEVNCSRLQYDFLRDALYKRMMQQLERREKIPLLNRSEGKPWTLVDLREDYDLELMKRFYKELIEPNKDASDVDSSMEAWLARFAPENQKKASGEDHHALVALRSGQEAPVLLGGLTFKYFSITNCGLMVRALVKNVEHREAVTKALVERAVDVLDQNAVSRGHLVGCNAIFLEIRETQVQKAGEQADFNMDISRQHLLLERMGWRLLDFNYVVPSMEKNKEPSRSLSLTVFLTSRIPRVPYAQEGYEYHYLPKPIVRSFMEHSWRSSSRSQTSFETDPEYVKMMDLIERRERIPLLELPWQRPWTLVDLWEDFDVELLYKFYNNFLVTAHPDKADREPLSDWLKFLSPHVRDNPETEDFHILLALNYPRSSSMASVNMKPNILGGLVFKFSSNTNCGLITFLSVAPQYGVVMAKALVEEATEILVENAMSRGHIAGCNAIFMEVPGSPRTALDEKNITFIDHDVLYSMGWKMLNFLYIQPPQSIHGVGKQCLLLALNTSNVPKEGAVAYIPKDLILAFVRSRWTSAYGRIGKLLSRDRLYKQTLQGLERLDRVVLHDPPWNLPPLPPPSDPVSANDSSARIARL